MFFDAGDTLIDFYSTGERVTRIVQERDGPAGLGRTSRALLRGRLPSRARWARERLSGSTDEATEWRYWADVLPGLVACGRGSPSDPALVRELVEDTIHVEIYAPFPDCGPRPWMRCAPPACGLVLISNAFPSMAAHHAPLDLERHFDTCLYSCEVGYEKPQPAIFDLALQAADLPPAQTCFVDDVPSNVEAATSLGIRGFLLDRWARHERSPLPRLASLTEFRERLGVG